MNDEISDEESGDDENTLLSCQESKRQRSEKEAAKLGANASSQTNLADQSLISASSSDESSSSSDDSKSEKNKIQTNKEREATHYCSYFKKDSSREARSFPCKHQTSAMQQNVCLDCEFSRTLKDSLEHMKFLSPPAIDMNDKNLAPQLDSLKFDSPTITVTSNPKKDSAAAAAAAVIAGELTSISDSETNNDSCLIVEATLSESELEEAAAADDGSYGSVSFQNSKCNSGSVASVLSESTLVWSDSDYDENGEELGNYKLSRERKFELKRKRVLEENEQEDEDDLYAYEKYFQSQPKESRSVDFNREGELTKSDDGNKWFCPCAQTSLASELDGLFKPSNDPIVTFSRSNGKFKMVIYKHFFC